MAGSIEMNTLLVRVNLNEIHAGTTRRSRTRIKPLVVFRVKTLDVLDQVPQILPLGSQRIRVPIFLHQPLQFHLFQSRG